MEDQMLADAGGRHRIPFLVGIGTVYGEVVSKVVWSSGCALAATVFGAIGSGFEPRSRRFVLF